MLHAFIDLFMYERCKLYASSARPVVIAIFRKGLCPTVDVQTPIDRPHVSQNLKLLRLQRIGIFLEKRVTIVGHVLDR